MTQIANSCPRAGAAGYEYISSPGYCVDANGRTSTAIYTDIKFDNDPICQDVCDRLREECTAWDIYPKIGSCEVIGPNVVDNR
eukprot:UN02732